MSGVMRSIAPEGGGFFLCAAPPTAPSEAVFAFGRELDSSGGCGRRNRAHTVPAAAS
jgi:hypothetical protein